ncbi:MAG TPA: nuclease-related domain-containing protein [Acidimicrobiales bacterium]|nr:nuclease-related domain-containing protein [Acidimicrobiales bacterium]
MPEDARRAHPLRRGFGILAGLVAAADIAIATAAAGNDFNVPSAPAESRSRMLAYGVAMLLVAVYAVATSFGREAAEAAPITIVPVEGEERLVIHALRDHGWYVADDVLLPHVEVDHLAIGPAGVLAVQVQWTNEPDTRGRPAARARIAAHQLRKALAAKEIDVDVVPAILTFGPGLTHQPGGVKVVDAVAMLNGYQAAEWIGELSRRVQLPDHTVDAVREVVCNLREHVAFEPAAARARQLASA